jgi:UDP-N-acetylmuramoylalanine--D-glutamate ligase
MKTAILGDGITARAVSQKLQELGMQEVPSQAADLVVASPGIPPDQFPSTSAEIVSEIEFAYRLLKMNNPNIKIIGVTGTNGKTTVTSLIAHVLDIPYAGNIGVPLVSFVGKKQPPIIVVELSSYQLELCTTFAPDISALLNITPDHLARHKTMEEYATQKAKIFACQSHSQSLIYYQDDHIVNKLAIKAAAKKIPYSKSSPQYKRLNNIKLLGSHNKLNAVAAWEAAKILGCSDNDIRKKIEGFSPVEHRIERVLEHKSRVFYNDSKSTNPDSTVVAVESFTQNRVLMLGGKDKGLRLEEFLLFLFSTVKTIVVFGEIADRLFGIAKNLNPNYPIFRFSSLSESIDAAYKCSAENEIILFSPACSSFDQFDNYEHRGQAFKRLLREKYGTAAQ